MSKTEFIKFRVDPTEKAAAEALADARGLTVSQMIRAYLIRAARAASRDESA